MTPYEIAVAKYDIEILAFEAALEAYRAGGSIEDLVKAKAARAIADREFDVAFYIAAEIPEETAGFEKPVVDCQLKFYI